MKYNFNVNFPELTFTSPGVYLYTIKELTPSGDRWKTDRRVYRVVVTVTKDECGDLVAKLDYPDGFPKFVNKYYRTPPPPPPPPPPGVCECFEKLPFPMHWFAPPQKAEFMENLRSAPHLL